MEWLIGATLLGGLTWFATRQQRQRRNTTGGYTLTEHKENFQNKDFDGRTLGG